MTERAEIEAMRATIRDHVPVRGARVICSFDTNPRRGIRKLCVARVVSGGTWLGYRRGYTECDALRALCRAACDGKLVLTPRAVKAAAKPLVVRLVDDSPWQASAVEEGGGTA